MSLSSPSLAVQIGSVQLDPCVLNASGPLCTSDDEVQALARSGAGGVVLKSATWRSRAGNPEPRVHADAQTGTSLNSVGLANLGYEAHADQVERCKAIADKPVIASMARLGGADNADHLVMAKRLGAVADAIEVNLSCPNVAGKPQMAFDLEAARATLLEIRQATDCDLWVKLPPYQDARLAERMAALLVEAQIQAAVCINSPSGLTLDLDRESTVIHPNGGMGGAGGPDITRIARWNIRQLSLALDGHAAVVGVGGITTGRDALGHVLCGASAVQIGTALLIEGPGALGRIADELRTALIGKRCGDIRQKISALSVMPASGTESRS